MKYLNKNDFCRVYASKEGHLRYQLFALDWSGMFIQQNKHFFVYRYTETREREREKKNEICKNNHRKTTITKNKEPQISCLH